MDLILWRHADAAPVKNESEPDIQPRLTDKGRKQAALMAIWIERRLPDSVRLLASPATRAQETAGALGRKFVTVGLHAGPGICCHCQPARPIFTVPAI